MIIPDASFDVVSVLEEHRIDFPSLIIQSAPKRYYPDSGAVAAFVGYTGEINETELASPQYQGYKAGQQIGKQGLEKQYEAELRGREGSRFVEVDARNSVLREVTDRQLDPVGAPPLYTNIDLDLQRFVAKLFADSLQGGVVAMVPQTGEVLALYSAPSFDPNRFIGGVSAEYYDSLRNDPRKPLYNKALQGTYPPGSTWKLATAVIALENNAVTFNEHMQQPCTGGYYFGNRYWRCWDKNGHGSLNLSRRDREVVRRLFLPARLAAAGVATRGRRREPRLRAEIGNRSARRAAAELPADSAVLQREVSGRLDAGGIAQPRDRSG